MHTMRAIMRFLFNLLYHQFAWGYDLVARVVSLGRWKGWVLSALPYLDGRVLEIGYGPGHLQMALYERNQETFGLDESAQMARLAKKRLRRKGHEAELVRALAGKIPFPEERFETVVATFPSEYIFAADTLAEVRRVLVPGGRLVVIPVAWITGGGKMERLMAWLNRVTGETREIGKVLPGTRKRFREGGFEVRHEVVEVPGSKVLVMVGRK